MCGAVIKIATGTSECAFVCPLEDKHTGAHMITDSRFSLIWNEDNRDLCEQCGTKTPDARDCALCYKRLCENCYADKDDIYNYCNYCLGGRIPNHTIPAGIVVQGFNKDAEPLMVAVDIPIYITKIEKPNFVGYVAALSECMEYSHGETKEAAIDNLLNNLVYWATCAIIRPPNYVEYSRKVLKYVPKNP